ncbi:hypothetical protein [Parachitinimonas caeni]|uniref:Uncharacterized protein n=1 Tax=Parachitinimonas caeni TaxID=3031301 RepID=A0ABT7E881_9NEIS|nr:hypothetical protein [Parachitinimonas caeni]MDK2127107.1 hypothetical protein [Parachitinimonas caeni]
MKRWLQAIHRWVSLPFRRWLGWWFSLSGVGQTRYFVMPNHGSLIFLWLPALWLMPAGRIPTEYGYVMAWIILLLPFCLLSVLRIQKGQVVHCHTLLLLPYWWTPMPRQCQFVRYDAWEDLAIGSVAFIRLPDHHEVKHLGIAANAEALYAAIGCELLRQGWVKDPGGDLRSPPA